MHGAFFVRSYMSGTRSEGGRKKEETAPFDGLAEDSRFEVFRVSMPTTLEDSDRVDSAQTTVKLSI